MGLEIINTANALDHGLKIIVYGAAGVGKTRLAATVGPESETLIVSAEAGLLSLRGSSIDAVVVDSIDKLREVAGFITKGGHKYKWVIIDSLSEIAEVCLSEEKKKNTNGMKAYGEMAEIIFKVIRAFRDIPNINVLFTCKQTKIQDQDGGILFGPNLPGKLLGDNLSYLFDEVFAMRTKRGDDGTVVRFLQTANDGYYEAKDRSGSLALYERPNIEKIAAKITAGVPADAAAAEAKIEVVKAK